jgi:hypothetical protein
MERARRLLGRPQIVYRVLVPLLVMFWFVGGIGKDKTSSEGGTYWVGAISWAGFLVTLLITVLFTITLIARRVLRRLATD